MTDKRFYTTEEVAKLYGIGRRQAQLVMAQVAEMHGGKLSLGKGKVTPRELRDFDGSGSAEEEK